MKINIWKNIKLIYTGECNFHTNDFAFKVIIKIKSGDGFFISSILLHNRQLIRSDASEARTCWCFISDKVVCGRTWCRSSILVSQCLAIVSIHHTRTQISNTANKTVFIFLIIPAWCLLSTTVNSPQSNIILSSRI